MCYNKNILKITIFLFIIKKQKSFHYTIRISSCYEVSQETIDSLNHSFFSTSFYRRSVSVLPSAHRGTTIEARNLAARPPLRAMTEPEAEPIRKALKIRINSFPFNFHVLPWANQISFLPVVCYYYKVCFS